MSGPRRRIGVAPLEETTASGWTGSRGGSPIDAHLKLIESSKATERAQGIQQLAEVLRDDGNSTHALAASLSSATWEHIVTWTARILIKESQAYVNRHGSEWPEMSTGAERMGSKIQTQYSNRIRHIWIAAMPHLPDNLARFLTKHMVESIQESPCLIGVFGTDYAKALRAWATHEPHVRNCRDGRAEAIVDMCIKWFSSRNSNVVESQMSVDSGLDQGVAPGDAEWAAVLLAIVASASPARLAILEEKVLDFCAEYGRCYSRENACHAYLLDAANVILLATADEQAVGHVERSKSLLSNCLRLWHTRSTHTKTSVLHSIRILSRLVAEALGDTSDTEARPLLELTLKYLTTGSWDKFLFMLLPSSLLSTWPLVQGDSAEANAPLYQRLARIWPMVDPNQLAFFDTVAFLVVTLMAHSTQADTGCPTHRKKRARTAPTPLARLLTAIGSEDSAVNTQGAAQVVWFIANFYACMLGPAQCQDLLQDIKSLVQSSDMSQRGDLAQWVLGIFYSLSRYNGPHSEPGAAKYTASDHVWRQAIARLEGGLAGAAALVFYMLHGCNESSADVCLLCQQAAGALAASPSNHGADVAQLSLLLAQNARPTKRLSSSESAAKVFSRAAMQLCQYAGKHRWSLALFSRAVGRVFGFSASSDQSGVASSTHAANGGNQCALGPGWITELRFLHVLQVLDALPGNANTHKDLVSSHADRSAAGSVVLSSLSVAQWHQVAQLLLKSVDQFTEHESSPFIREALPYIAHALWQISQHVAGVEQHALYAKPGHVSVLAAQIASGLSERLVAIVSNAKNTALAWRTLTFVHMWPACYNQLAEIEGVASWLLAALFASDHSILLCELSWGDPGTHSMDTACASRTSQPETQAAGSAEAGRHRPLPTKDGGSGHTRSLEAHMLSTSARLVSAPWSPIVAILSALIERRAELGLELATRLEDAIETLDALPLLTSGELIVRCAALTASNSRELLFSRILKRTLPLLDSYEHVRHMPTTFATMQIVHAVIPLGSGTELGNGEDLPRFVAWLAMEAQAGHVDPFLEVHFLRLIVGPWGRAESDALTNVLSIIDTSPGDLLAYRAQGATDFAVRIAAEEQLALYGLKLPFLRSNGSLVYPDAPQTEARDTLVFITRDIGLALLVASTGYVVPGALCILLRQVHLRSGCSPIVVNACQRLLASIAAVSGFSSVSLMIGACSADIFCVNPELLDAVIEYLGPQLSPELELQLRLDAALEWMLRGELESALGAMPKAATGVELETAVDAWPVSLFVHLLVVEVNDPELFTRIRRDILVPCTASERLKRLTKDTPELVVTHLLALRLPEKSAAADVKMAIESMTSNAPARPISLAFQRLCEPQLGTCTLPQWGRHYSRQSICSAIEAVAKSSCGGLADEFLTNARTAWIIVQIQSQLQAARHNEQRQQLAGSLCLLLNLVLPDVLDSPLVQAVLIRALVDLWRQRCEYARILACLATSLLLDSSASNAGGTLISMIGAGLLDASTTEDPKHSQSLWPLTSLLQAAADSGSSVALDYSKRLFVGSDFEALYDWTRLPSLVVTRSAIRQCDDRVSLADIADRAASQLSTVSNSTTCAEILVESIERLLQLALPLGPESKDPSPPDAVASEPLAEIDLAANVVAVLLRVQQSVLSYIRGTHINSRHANTRVTAMLLRATSLLRAIEHPGGGSAVGVASSKAQLLAEGDLGWLVCDVVTRSPDLGAVVAAIGVAGKVYDTTSSEAADALERLDGRQRWIFRDVASMPAIATDFDRRPSWLCRLEVQPLRLDYALLETLCAGSKSPSDAFSELVRALASCKECTRVKPAIPLILADSRAASCLLPHVLLEILPTADTSTREEIAAFLLDFVHNWRDRAPGMARDVIARTLETRQLDQQYSDIRKFFEQLPLALFEMADLAAKLGMPETAAFLLECDLTCTGDERLADIGAISSEARELLQAVNRKLGNQPAAQLLSSVSSVDDILRRCRDTSDWRTLLMYQEAAHGSEQHQLDDRPNASEFEIGDTLVSLGLLNAMRPPSFGEAGFRPTGLSSGALASTLQAAYGASWRLAKWDVPTVPLAQRTASHCSHVFLAPVDRSEEALYSLLRLRSNGQSAEAVASVQEFMASARAVAAIAEPASSLREAWSYRAVGMLLPLFSTRARQSESPLEFLHTSQIASALLARNRGTMPAEAAEPIYQVNLTLHEIAVCEAVAAARGPSDGSETGLVFSRYKESVRLACVTARQARNWQSSMNHIFRLRAMARSVGYLDNTLEPELKLWEAETLWESGSRALAIEVLQSHKREMAQILQQARVELSPRLPDSAAMVVSPVLAQPPPSTAQRWTGNEVEAATILMSRIILTVGEWSDQQRRERPAVLWTEYFNKSAILLQEINSPTAWTGRALHALAAFAERQCVELTSTRDDESAIAVRRQKTRELAVCREEIARTSNTNEAQRLRGIMRRLEIQVTNDQTELDELRTSIGGFLRLAIWSFVKCLACTDAFDNCVYSLVSLIVTNARAQELQRALSSSLMDCVPSHKFLPLVHQLCARLSTEEDAFHQTTMQLVSRMAVEYPYHTMYHLFALRNANRAQSSSAAKLARKGSLSALKLQESEKMEERRSEAATSILTSVSSKSPDLHSIAQAINELCTSYIDLAVCSVPDKFKNSKLGDNLIPFNSKTRISRLVKDLPRNIPVLTAAPRADAPCDYMCVPFVSSIAAGYSLAGGINLPKILRLVGSDGKRYKQLVKGKDDLRQDAIIQQLFHVINRFMRSAGARAFGSASSAVSSLHIRTYQVVPLTKRCGVLQWVDNTMPFGTWFQGREKRYRPNAPTMSQLRVTIHDVHKDKAVTAQQKLEVFERVCSLAPPVFRFFFYEQFYNAQDWFEHRETYIRSAAVSSIAGWVLGIGDRHLQNILVDRSTAELVHIDLGIAFDMGKLLPIPELVPFRLTREVIDGMGLLGLDGTFQHSCQAALQAMRDNAQVVITILNVLKVDPLYMWSLIPLRQDKMNRNVSMYLDEIRDNGRGTGISGDLGGEDNNVLGQESDEEAAEDENKEAGRSILHVGQRLGATISVEGQVSELIQQATDPGLLSRLFEGWSAWY
ncbi:hypothetical protein GGI20_002889 [Coemansia sp. BCRC 34301]|nr:hypothetical protein GGI20_002889 [Coemansia sp. BCRC 34301]